MAKPTADELKRRADQLAQEAEALSANVEAISEKKLQDIKEDREIRQVLELSGLEVSNAQPDYHYAWVYRDPFNRFGGRMVFELKAQGFEVVSGDMPEAQEHRVGPAGERWIGDVLLMRIPKVRWELLQNADRARRLRANDVNGALRQWARRFQGYGARVNEQFSPGAR